MLSSTPKPGGKHEDTGCVSEVPCECGSWVISMWTVEFGNK